MLQTNTTSQRPTLKLGFIDFWEGFEPKYFFAYTILNKTFDIILTLTEPHFLFHSCFDWRHTGYDCVKISFIGENTCPDFNVSDYAFSFDHLHYEDRHFRLPLYRLRMNNNIDYFPRSREKMQQLAQRQRKFCNFIYSNGHNSAPERVQIFEMLSLYKPVDSGGGYKNNIGKPVTNKLIWQKGYTFSIAFENSSKSGYTTEKILNALQADTIPIYWGNPRITEDFNEKRFINCHSFASTKALLERIIEIDNNPALQAEILAEPWFHTYPVKLEEDPGVITFLMNIIKQGPKKAKRIPATGWASLITKEMQRLQYHS